MKDPVLQRGRLSCASGLQNWRMEASYSRKSCDLCHGTYLSSWDFWCGDLLSTAVIVYKQHSLAHYHDVIVTSDVLKFSSQ
ncbi:hypothetical protein C0J52_02217 [Blattella germanica]|nr:hypothetical protein C0J52_02217 [Blattella germanica]